MKRISLEVQERIIKKLLDGKKPKYVIHEEQISRSFLYKVKKMYPLFFWKK